MRTMLARLLNVPTYPHTSALGNVTILGPECFADTDGDVICWKGRNYYRVKAPSALKTARATLSRVTAERDHAWTLLHAIKRAGVLPGPAWERAVNGCTASESEGDLERDKAAAEDLRARLQAADSIRGL